MQKNKNIVKQFSKRLSFIILSLTIFSITWLYYIQKKHFYNKLVSNISKHINNGFKESSEINFPNNTFIKHIKMLNFLSFDIYNEKIEKIYTFSNSINNSNTIKFIKNYISSLEKDLKTIKRVDNVVFKAPNSKYFILIYYPVYKKGTLIGYIRGVKNIEDSLIKKFKEEIIYTISVILLTILFFTIFIFPIIYISSKKLYKHEIELISKNITTLNTLGNAIALRDSDTNEHNYRVSIYSILLAKELKLDKQEIKKLIIGAFTHDIGKIGITDNILLKKGKLDQNEFEIMKEHVMKGVKLIKDNNWLENGKDVILYHHEKYDGSGYPNKIVGNDIPKVARIFAIVDVFDALTSKRPYKEPFSYNKSIKILLESSGTHFDPEILNRFIKISKILYEETVSKSHKQLKHDLDNLIINYFMNIDI